MVFKGFDDDSESVDWRSSFAQESDTNPPKYGPRTDLVMTEDGRIFSYGNKSVPPGPDYAFYGIELVTKDGKSLHCRFTDLEVFNDPVTYKASGVTFEETSVQNVFGNRNFASGSELHRQLDSMILRILIDALGGSLTVTEDVFQSYHNTDQDIAVKLTRNLKTKTISIETADSETLEDL
jgi:hypothetical protein